jgi:hypothetical protein
LKDGYLGMAGGKWKCCNAFDMVENNDAAFREFHKGFLTEPPAKE